MCYIMVHVLAQLKKKKTLSFMVSQNPINFVLDLHDW